MTANVTHAFVSGVADDPAAANAGEVLPSHWNANHIVSVDTDGFNTFYVSPSGSDSNSGTKQSAAWKTIAHVNAQTFGPGSIILFQGGQTFSGTTLTPGQGGVDGAPITFGSYGTGQATISVTTASGISWSNLSNLVVRDLIVTGSGGTTQAGVVGSYTTSNSNVIIDNLTVSGFPSDGIRIGVTGTAVLTGLKILNCNSNSNTGGDTVNMTAGIRVFGAIGENLIGTGGQISGVYNLHNLLIENCLVYSNGGNASSTQTYGCGYGIVANDIINSVVNLCECHDNAAIGTGGVDIMFVDASDSKITNCLTYGGAANFTGGIDLDGGCVNCIIDSCVSHDHKLEGILIFGALFGGAVTGNDNNVISNCFSYNDATLGGTGRAGISVNGNANAPNTNAYVVDSVAIGVSAAAILVHGSAQKTIAIISGNIFIGTSTNVVYHTDGFAGTSLAFIGNEYFAENANPFVYNATNYQTVGTWRAAAPGSSVEPASAINEINVSKTTIAGGTSPRVLYDNSGALGEASALTISSGQPNVASGSAYLHTNTQGTFNALYSVGNATLNNWFIGQSGNFSVSGQGNMGMGQGCLQSISTGQQNLAIGTAAMTALTNGLQNVGVGTSCLAGTASGGGNVAIGFNSFGNGANPHNAVAIGYQAALNVTSNAGAGYGVYIGYQAGVGSTSAGDSGYGNIVIGPFAGTNLAGSGFTNGETNIVIGEDAANGLTNGNSNVIIGGRGPAITESAGGTITTGSQNIVIGACCDVPNAASNGQMSIGNVIYGINNIGHGTTLSTGFIGIGKTIPVVEFDVNGRIKTATSATSNLPAAGNVGARYLITDGSSSATLFSTPAGGGSFNAPVYDDGTKWRYG